MHQPDWISLAGENFSPAKLVLPTTFGYVTQNPHTKVPSSKLSSVTGTMQIDNIPILETIQPPKLRSPLPNPAVATCKLGEFQLQRYRLTDGLRSGVELLVIDSGNAWTALCPTRGLSLWKAHIGGIDCGWDSPVAGPIHPNFVASNEPSGIGWLDGFDEHLVRCGVRNFGPPGFDDAGRVNFPLHGRVGNLPVENLRVSLDPELSQLHVSGDVWETRFLQYRLRLQVGYTFTFGSPTFGISDCVINAGGTPTSMQLLYHINVGRPLLETGSKLHLGVKQVFARDGRAAEDLTDWNTYLGPTAGYAEQVYFSRGSAGSDGWAKALLTSADETQGFAVHFDPSTLPCFTQWKNTVAEADGYVTGLEPSTGFPNPRSFEESKGRLVELAAGESREFRLKLEGISTATRVAEIRAELKETRQGVATEAVASHPDYCTP